MRFAEPAQTLFQHRSIGQNPAIDRAVIYRKAPFPKHYLPQVPV